MAGQVLYVHGAGNRREQAHTYAQTIREHTQLGARLIESKWGDLGPDATLPGLEGILPAQPVGPMGAADGQNLVQDPYAGLRALNGGAGATADAQTILAILA